MRSEIWAAQRLCKDFQAVRRNLHFYFKCIWTSLDFVGVAKEGFYDVLYILKIILAVFPYEE